MATKSRYGASFDPPEPLPEPLQTILPAWRPTDALGGTRITRFLQNSDVTAGVLLSGDLPPSWTRYVDLTADVGDSFIRHDKFELKYSGSAVFRPSTLPGSPEEGEFVYTSATKQFQFWNGTAWVGLSSGSVGVASVVGTANQVTVSPITGNVVVSLPSSGTLPGSWTAQTALIVGTDPGGSEPLRVGGTARIASGGSSIVFGADSGKSVRINGTTPYHELADGANPVISWQNISGRHQFNISGVGKLHIATGAVTPATAGGLSLGTHQALPWGDLQMGSTIWFHTDATRNFALSTDGVAGRLSFYHSDGGSIRFRVNADGLVETINDFKIGSLGRFDSTDTPTEGQLLIYKAGAINKWQAESLNAIWGDTDFKAAILADGAATYIFFDPGTGADSPVGAPPTPGALTVTQQHGTHTVELRDYVKPADFRWFEFEYSKNGVDWLLLANATSPKAVHARLPFDGTTFRYRVRIEDRAGNHSADSAVAGPFTPTRTGETHAFGAIVAGEIAVANLAAITATMGILTSGQIRGPGNIHGINFSGAGGIPGTWVSGINFENTPVTGMTRYLNFNSTAHNNLFKTERLTIGHDGTVEMYQTGAQPLFKLNATDFLLQEDAVTPTRGILIDGTLPAGWTRYLNLNGTGAFLKHERLEFNFDGSVKMYGTSARTVFNLTGADYYLQQDAVTPLGGVLVMGTLPGSWTRYLNVAGSGTFLKHERGEWNYDGSVKMYQTSSQPMFKLDATDFLLQNDAASPTQGILIDGTLPAAWTRYFNLNGVGSMVKHEKMELNYDGSIKLKKIVVILTAGTSWTVPADFNPFMNSVELVGGGGGGAGGVLNVEGGGGGAGGGHSRITAFNPGSAGSITYAIGAAGTAGGAGGGNGGNGGQTSWNSGTVTANGGAGATDASGALGVGGGNVFNGGVGGNGAVGTGDQGGGGGGGAGGPNSVGLGGSDPGSGGAGGNGGSPNGGSGGAVGAGGANGTAWTANPGGSQAGSGGGGGGGSAGGVGGAGGNYGAGGGGGGSTAGSSAAGGAGKAGVIVITYFPIGAL